MTLNTNPRRDARATFAGYVYQVNVSILRWLSLKPGEHLELEAGEDIDLIRDTSSANETEKERVLEQLKQTSRAITLRSADALEALANYCHHRKANPTTPLTFRFLTTSSVGKERQPWTGEGPAITLWEGLRIRTVPETERAARFEEIRTYLKDCPKPEDLSDTVWQSLREILNAEIGKFEAFVNGFEWATESGNHEAIEKAVIERLKAREQEVSEARAKISYRNLFGFVIKLLTESGSKTLTVDRLVAELTAMRPGEVFSLRWQHILLNEHRGLIRIVDGKFKAARRMLPMTPNVYAVLMKRFEAAGQPVDGSCVSQ